MPISEFLRRIREKVGHDLLILPAAAVALFDAEDRVLLVRLSDTGRWALPGGSIEPGELPANAAVREMWEESGIIVELVRVLGVFGGPGAQIEYPNGDRTAYVATIWQGRQTGGRPEPRDGEATEVRYFSKAEVLGDEVPLAPTTANALPGVFAAYANPNGDAHFVPADYHPPADS